jgi:kumamolisin
MWRTLISWRTLVSPAALLLLLAALLGGYAIASRGAAISPHAYVTLTGSFPGVPQNARLAGHHESLSQLGVSIALRPNHEAEMDTLLANLYDPNSPQYQHWLATGEFTARFAPTAAQIAQVQSFLTQAGLQIVSAPTPFLVRATGTTAQIEAAFHTRLDNYTAANGKSFWQNDTPVQVPANLGSLVLAITGLTNTVNAQPHYVLPLQAINDGNAQQPQYGAGPGGSGLTPAQLINLYGGSDTQARGDRGKGKGATLGVFELSGYTPADIVTYEHQFFGPSEHVHLVDVNVDGGPITPQCPVGDFCTPPNFFAGDIEVEADIETQIALAPKISTLYVYNAPNDVTGQVNLDLLFRIAQDNLADSISTSWGLCELDAGFAFAQAESIPFAQIAAQGQSMFSSSGDSGAFSCLRGSGRSDLSVVDPASQPFVTGVGGTSFSSFDPQGDQHPAYPTGFETVWNPLGMCSGSNLGGCTFPAATGGGVSAFWSQPGYQHGPGVTSTFSQKAPYCSQAVAGQSCREVPDIAANADEFTPYAEFCTGDPNTDSACAVRGGKTVPGWFGIAGTSLSSPLMSAVIALWDSVHGKRFGSANFGLYQLFRSHDAYSRFFHDITGIHQTENNNGYYPTTPGYDMTTGVGTPRIDGIVEANF